MSSQESVLRKDGAKLMLWTILLILLILWLVGLLGGFAGAIVVISRGRIGSDLLRLSGTKGDLLILASTVTWAIYSVIGHDTLKRLGPTRATAGAMMSRSS